MLSDEVDHLALLEVALHVLDHSHLHDPSRVGGPDGKEGEEGRRESARRQRSSNASSNSVESRERDGSKLDSLSTHVREDSCKNKGRRGRKAAAGQRSTEKRAWKTRPAE